MSIRSDEDEGFPRERQIPYLTAQDALTAGSNEERRRILTTIQAQQTARANELMKLSHATLHPHQPAWIKKNSSAVSMR